MSKLRGKVYPMLMQHDFKCRLRSFLFLFLLAGTSGVVACSGTSIKRLPANEAFEIASEKDEYFSALSNYPDGIAVSGYTRVYNERIFTATPNQVVAQGFLLSMATNGDFELFVQGPPSLTCHLGEDRSAPYFHPKTQVRGEQIVQMFSLKQNEQPRLFSKLYCRYSGQAPYLDPRLTVRFPSPRARLSDDLEKLRNLREALYFGRRDFQPHEQDWVLTKAGYQSRDYLLVPKSPMVSLQTGEASDYIGISAGFKRDDKLDYFSRAEGDLEEPTEIVAQPKRKRRVPPRSHFEFPNEKLYGVLCFDAKNSVVLQGDKKPLVLLSGGIGEINCTINTPVNGKSDWKGRFVIRTVHFSVDDLKQKLEAILQPAELGNIEKDVKLAVRDIQAVQREFQNFARLTLSHSDEVYTALTKKKIPPLNPIPGVKLKTFEERVQEVEDELAEGLRR